MSPRVIDLRKPSSDEDVTNNEPRTDGLPHPHEKNDGVDRAAAIAWTCDEHQERARGRYWFLFPGAVATLLIIVGVVQRNFLFIGFVTISFALLTVFMGRRPKRVSFALTKEGVDVNGTFYEYANIKSFWVFHEGGYELSLETKKMFMPFIRTPLGDRGAEEVRKFLGQYIAEAEHQNFASDQIAKMLGF